ncbi:DoxX family protein [Anditalea andensis]|uniref:Membrane protein n=1 Tax=Anditalea andensis TaxID=1048983 RepID=A0A074KWT8_9BACT|nr:membrane protein [Anditalea andensis]KEO72660.1 membrane protein [Anditalea andensis]
MKPFIVLIGVFAFSMLTTKIGFGQYDVPFSGRMALSAMFLFSAMGHFLFTKGMSLMIPPFVPFKIKIVYWTGILEIAFAIGLLISDYSITSAWGVIIFLIMVLPVNIYASIKQVDYQKATYYGKGLSYLWFRIPLQLLYITWTYIFFLKY